jgi:3D (Asp-Asp-Asp) domain-containing protein
MGFVSAIYCIATLIEEGKQIENDLTEMTEQADQLRKERTELNDSLWISNQKLDKSYSDLSEAQEQIKELGDENSKLKQENKDLQAKVQSTSVAPSNTKVINMTASAYTASCKGCSGITAWKGLDLRSNPQLKVIAVDPRVIPLGSKVYVEGYGNAVAADTGGAIKGNKIDIFIPSKSKAISWGRREVKVHILN